MGGIIFLWGLARGMCVGRKKGIVFLDSVRLGRLTLGRRLISPFGTSFYRKTAVGLALSSRVGGRVSDRGLVVIGGVRPRRCRAVSVDRASFRLRPGRSILIRTRRCFGIPAGVTTVVLRECDVGLLNLIIDPTDCVGPNFRKEVDFLVAGRSGTPVRLMTKMGFYRLTVMRLSSRPRGPCRGRSNGCVNDESIRVSGLRLSGRVRRCLGRGNLKSVSRCRTQRLNGRLLGGVSRGTRGCIRVVHDGLNNFSRPAS